MHRYLLPSCSAFLCLRQIEVPADQHGPIIQICQKHIRAGLIEGVTDPEAAYDIIKKRPLLLHTVCAGHESWNTLRV
jgi:hypothetical protein